MVVVLMLVNILGEFCNCLARAFTRIAVGTYHVAPEANAPSIDC